MNQISKQSKIPMTGLSPFVHKCTCPTVKLLGSWMAHRELRQTERDTSNFLPNAFDNKTLLVQEETVLSTQSNATARGQQISVTTHKWGKFRQSEKNETNVTGWWTCAINTSTLKLPHWTCNVKVKGNVANVHVQHHNRREENKAYNRVLFCEIQWAYMCLPEEDKSTRIVYNPWHFISWATTSKKSAFIRLWCTPTE